MPALKSMFGSLIKGEFKEAAGYAFIDQGTVDTLAANKSQLEKRILEGQVQGIIPKEAGDKIMNDIANTAFPDTPKLTGEDPVNIFTQGVKRDVGQAFSAVALAIPWQVYVVGLIVVAIWLIPTVAPFAARFMKRS